MSALPHDQWIEMQLVAIERAGPQTNIYRFARSDGAVLPPAEAGSHIALLLPNGLERQYSILHPAQHPHEYAVGVKHEPEGRGGSDHLHRQMRVGDKLPVHPPRNNFPLAQGDGDTVLIGGGIGITPMIAMAEQLLADGRVFQLHAAFRSGEDRIFTRELARFPNVRLHLDSESGSHFPMADVVATAAKGAHLYCCGPTAMLSAFLECAVANGRDEDHAHVEYFSAHEAPASEGGFTVELAKSGRSLKIPAGRSILSVLEEAGVPVLSSCEEGICGACEVRLLDGIPDHRDAVLSPAERRANQSIMVCCSGAISDRLVLDL